MNDKTKLLIIISFNFLLMVVEIVGGIISGSLALLSDAGHMLTDTTALLVSYAAIFISEKPPTRWKTFGYKRAEVLAALFNGTLLGVLSLFILYEAVIRLWRPVEIKTLPMLIISVVGLIGNAAGIFILRVHKHHDGNFNSDHLSHQNINIRGAYYHIMADMFSSVMVVLGAVVIRLTGFYLIDSLLGIFLGIAIIKGALNLLKDSINILMESTPSDIDVDDLSLSVEKAVNGVKNFHDVHVWSISSDRRSLSAHVELVDDISVSETQNKILCDIRKYLFEKYNIQHTTLEVECGGCHYQLSSDGSPIKGGGSCYL